MISGDWDLGRMEVAEVTTTTGGVDGGLGALDDDADDSFGEGETLR